jgi:hypothetical protein
MQPAVVLPGPIPQLQRQLLSRALPARSTDTAALAIPCNLVYVDDFYDLQDKWLGSSIVKSS